jgi:hypothetical protein
MSRIFLSRPVQQLLADGLLEDGSTFFDFGCGRGGDVRQLRELGHDATGWDPAHAPGEPRRRAKVVNLGYVVNVIEAVEERREVLRQAWQLAEEVLVIAARLDWEVNGSSGKAFGDGLVTKTGTFQKYYSQEELRAWIESTLGQRSVAAAPGVFYVFRSETAGQRLLARHARSGSRVRLGIADLVYNQHHELLEPLEQWVEQNQTLPNPTDLSGSHELIETFGSIRAAFSLIRRATRSERWVGVDLGTRRSSEALFEANLMTLQPLIDFLTERGRLPHEAELPEAPAIEGQFGSIRRALSLIRRVTGSERWADFEARSRQDFLVYLALAAFNGRPKFSDLPLDLQYDSRDLFGSYKEACAQADKLLFAVGNQEAIDLACRAAGIGKLTPEALYVHVKGLAQLSAMLRVYVGCAETLTGQVDDATLLKIHRLKPQVSFLVYPGFDKEPHPVLSASIVGRLRELAVTYRDFTQRENPPILHRKEAFVPVGYPGREKFERLTLQEERAELLNQPTIGTRAGWQEALASAGFELRGHRLVKTREPGRRPAAQLSPSPT